MSLLSLIDVPAVCMCLYAPDEVFVSSADCHWIYCVLRPCPATYTIFFPKRWVMMIGYRLEDPEHPADGQCGALLAYTLQNAP